MAQPWGKQRGKQLGSPRSGRGHVAHGAAVGKTAREKNRAARAAGAVM